MLMEVPETQGRVAPGMGTACLWPPFPLLWPKEHLPGSSQTGPDSVSWGKPRGSRQLEATGHSPQMLPGPGEMEGWRLRSPLEPALLPGSWVLAPEGEGGRLSSCKLFRSQLP